MKQAVSGRLDWRGHGTRAKTPCPVIGRDAPQGGCGLHVGTAMDNGDTALDNAVLFTSPEGHVFVMGDNRDNSLDSRTPPQADGPGLVPSKPPRGRVIPARSGGDAVREPRR